MNDKNFVPVFFPRGGMSPCSFQRTPSAGCSLFWVLQHTYVFFPKTPPCVTTSSTTALAKDGAAYWVQACSTCVSLSAWSGTTIPHQWSMICSQFQLSTQWQLWSAATDSLGIPLTCHCSAIGLGGELCHGQPTGPEVPTSTDCQCQ